MEVSGSLRRVLKVDVGAVKFWKSTSVANIEVQLLRTEIRVYPLGRHRAEAGQTEPVKNLHEF